MHPPKADSLEDVAQSADVDTMALGLIPPALPALLDLPDASSESDGVPASDEGASSSGESSSSASSISSASSEESQNAAADVALHEVESHPGSFLWEPFSFVWVKDKDT